MFNLSRDNTMPQSANFQKLEGLFNNYKKFPVTFFASRVPLYRVAILFGGFVGFQVYRTAFCAPRPLDKTIPLGFCRVGRTGFGSMKMLGHSDFTPSMTS
jgi:hypothetical protein